MVIPQEIVSYGAAAQKEEALLYIRLLILRFLLLLLLPLLLLTMNQEPGDDPVKRCSLYTLLLLPLLVLLLFLSLLLVTLNHEAGNDPVERGSLIAESLFPGAELAEVLCGFGHGVAAEFHRDSPGVIFADRHVEIHARQGRGG